MTLEFTDSQGTTSTAMGNAFSAAQAQQNQQKTAAPQGQQGQYQYVPGSNPFGFNGVGLTPGRIAYSPLAGSMGSEAYTKLFKELRELIAETNRQPALNVQIFELDKNVDPNLHYNGYVLTVQAKAEPNIGVGYHVILMAGTAPALNDRTISVQGGHGVSENVTIPFYPELAFTKRFFEITNNLLTQVFGTNVPFFRATPTVVPADFDYENKQAVLSLADNSATAASTILTMFAENGKWFSDLDLVGELKKRGGGDNDPSLTFNYNFHSQQLLDYMKQPTRASIVLQAQTGNRKGNQEWDPNSGTGPKTITEATGFIELMPVAPRFNPQAYNPMTGQWAQQGQNGSMPTQRLAPVFVLNGLRANFGYSPGSILANILVAADLNRGYGWVRSFEASMGNRLGKLNLADVTAITIDMPSRENPNVPEDRPKFENGGMTPEFLMNFLGMYCQPEMYLATDIPVNNHNSWYLSLFSDAARGEPYPNKIIDETMVRLVGEEFKANLPAGTPKFATTPFLMERGWYEWDGQRRDIADIDYVAVCNFADESNNPRMVEVWTNSFLSNNRSMEQRLQDRREIIQEITGNKATFTGFVVRVFWNGVYIDAALRTLAQRGVTTNTEGRNNYSFNGGRATADFLQGNALSSQTHWASNMSGGSGRFNFNLSGGSPWNTGMGAVYQGAI